MPVNIAEKLLAYVTGRLGAVVEELQSLYYRAVSRTAYASPRECLSGLKTSVSPDGSVPSAR